MMNKIKMLGVLLAVLLSFTLATQVFAAGYGSRNDGSFGNGNEAADNKGAIQLPQPGQKDKSSNQNETSKNLQGNTESGNGDNLRERTRLMEETCSLLKEQLLDVENIYDELQKQYQTALKQQDQNEAELLKKQLQLMEREKDEYTEKLSQTRLQLKEAVRASYTEEELAQIETVEKKLKQKHPKDKVLPVESIIPFGFSLKLDTPPIIRDGRTLVPIRAFAEATGSTVIWNDEDDTIVINKEGNKIQLQLRNRLAYVNGQEITLDVSPEIINNRTVVPFRFLMEQLGYEVDWDTENDLIEIISPER